MGFPAGERGPHSKLASEDTVLSVNDGGGYNIFQSLEALVREWSSRGLRCLGAKLKPEMYRRYGFVERQHGFVRFGDFLREAQKMGCIVLTQTAGGDLEAFLRTDATGVPQYATAHDLAQAAPSSLSASAPSHSPLRIRQDLWNAFTSYAPGWVYDRQKDIAFRSHQAPVQETPAPNGVLIPVPSGRNQSMNWAQEFVDSQTSATKARLQEVLKGESGMFGFRRAVTADPILHRAWRRHHVLSVIAAIQKWASIYGVEPRGITETLGSPKREPAPVLAVRVPSSTVRTIAAPHVLPDPTDFRSASPAVPGQQSSQPTGLESQLATRLPELIDQLIDELLRFRGALQIAGLKR